MSTNKRQNPRSRRPVLGVLTGLVLVGGGVLGLVGWVLLQPPRPAPAWPAGLSSPWAFYVDDVAILGEGHALAPLADLCLDFYIPPETRTMLLRGPQSRWPWERTAPPGGPVLFLKLADTWMILVQPSYFSAPTALAHSIDQLEATPESPAPHYCTTPYGIAISPSLAALRAVVEAPAGPALSAPGLHMRWAGDGGDALAKPRAAWSIQDTPELDFTARLPWTGVPLPSARLRPWLPPGAAVAVQAPEPGVLIHLVRWTAQSLRMYLGGTLPLPPGIDAWINALDSGEGMGMEKPSHVRAAWLGVDAADVLPWPMLACAVSAPDAFGDLLDSLSPGQSHIPYQWDQVPGIRVPIWGDQVSLCLASLDGYWYAASRESAMRWILASPGPSGSSFPAVLQVQGNWQVLVGAVATLGRFAAREGIMRSVDEATFEQRWLPRILALGDLGTFAAGFEAAPGNLALNVTGRLAAGAAP